MASLDNWNSNDKAASLRQFAEGLRDQSKLVFLKDKFHTEIFFLITDAGQGSIVQPQKVDDRDKMVAKLKIHIKAAQVYGVVHIVEGWSYFPKAKGDHTMKQILEGEIAVSELRPEDRSEALIVMMESRDGHHMMWVTPILRQGDGVTLGPTLDFDEPPGGRFAGLFGS